MDLTSPWNSLDLADDSWNSESSNPNPTDELTSSPEASESTHSLQWDHPTTVPGTYGANPSYFGPTIDFTSEQAAQALTSLSHPPIKNFETDDFLDCCQPCDQQCNPDEIFQCFSVDTVPCYDEKCSQTCELDGVNTLCNDSHLDGMVGILCCLHEGCTFQTLSEAELLHHCTIAHACGAKTHWECRNHTIPEPGALHGHVHNEHCRDEFINPLLLHPDGCSKKPAVPPHYHVHDHHHPPLQRFHDSHAGFHFDSSHNSKAYCRGPERNASYLQDEMRHIGRTQSGLNSLREESRTSSRHTSLSMASPDLNCTSPISSARSEHFETISDGQSGVQQVYTCSWIPEKATAPCSLTFNTAFELQIHVEESHLALHEYTAMSKKAEQLMCRWNGCTFAQTKKKWRQVQHLKDHLRTHTKREFLRVLIGRSNNPQTRPTGATNVTGCSQRRNRSSSTAVHIQGRSHSNVMCVVLPSRTNPL